MNVEGGRRDDLSSEEAMFAVIANSHHKEVNTSRSSHLSSDMYLYFLSNVHVSIHYDSSVQIYQKIKVKLMKGPFYSFDSLLNFLNIFLQVMALPFFLNIGRFPSCNFIFNFLGRKERRKREKRSIVYGKLVRNPATEFSIYVKWFLGLKEKNHKSKPNLHPSPKLGQYFL